MQAMVTITGREMFHIILLVGGWHSSSSCNDCKALIIKLYNSWPDCSLVVDAPTPELLQRCPDCGRIIGTHSHKCPVKKVT